MAINWKTPPTVPSSINRQADVFMAVVKSNLQGIKDALVSKAMTQGGVDKPYLGATAVGRIIDKLIIAPTHGAEGGWSDHPNDSGGPTMRGIILQTFRGSFDNIFINTGIPSVANAARAFKATGWATGGVGSPGWDLGKAALFRVCSDADIASLWIFSFAASKTNKYPAAIMASEPYLGYLMHQGAWASGGNYFTMYGYDKKFAAIGYNNTKSVASVTRSAINFDGTNILADRAFPVALQALASHSEWVLTQQNTKNSVFVKGWLNRLVYSPSISWTHNIVAFTNAFEKNQIGTTESENKYLLAKAKMYKQMVLNFPNIS
jgi:hypothetical protein